MATDADGACYEWSSHDELAHRDDSQDDAFSESISFGSYSVDSLSWEKRSVFTYNKCQEELEKVKSPGLVAQKKAYFEEYYKRIRAMKALEENHQTELTMDYGGDSSMSSQTWEEEETVALVDYFVNESASVDYLLAKESKINSSLEKVPQTGHLDSMLPSHDLSTRHMEEFGIEVKYRNSIQMCHLDTESIVHEVTVQHDIIDLQEEISRKDENSIFDVEPEEAADGTFIPNTALGIRDLQCRPVTDIAQNKNKPAIKTHADHLALSRVKDFVASARNGLKLEGNAKSDKVKSLQGLKHTVQKITGKAELNICSRKATSNTVSSNSKSTSAASHKPFTEVRSNVTIPCPFSLATERRAAAHSGSKEVVKISDTKMPHRLSLNRSKGVLNIQGSPNKTSTTKAIKSKEQENRRSQDRVMLRTIAFNRQSSDSTVALGLKPSKARFVNLPACDKSNSSCRINNMLATSIAVNKHKEIKEDSKPRNSHVLDTKLIAPPSRTSIVGSKKVSPSSINNTKLTSKKPHISYISHDGRKQRQEMPRWR
ncbi:hypothetical protein IHE45_10G049800 [Dioscorea alata]|uniref:Uncharacterized protein n=1 Tax=Dioscorea alata TaxID=55571 RepID=A0ACB7VB66_DIOAL|nr:hypothetical protein IHE45_10G049800 [Dioscorea alata]